MTRTQTWTVNVAGTASVLRFSSPDTVIGGTATPAKADMTSSAGDASLLEFIGWPHVSGLGSPQSLPSSTVPLAAWKRHRTTVLDSVLLLESVLRTTDYGLKRTGNGRREQTTRHAPFFSTSLKKM